MGHDYTKPKKYMGLVIHSSIDCVYLLSVGSTSLLALGACKVMRDLVHSREKQKSVLSTVRNSSWTDGDPFFAVDNW